MDKQDDIVSRFETDLVSRAQGGEISLPRVEIKERAGEPEWTLVLDPRNERLLFNVSAKEVAGLLADSDDLDLLACYTTSLLAATQAALGDRKLTSFEVRSRQIVELRTKKNYELMDEVLVGLTTGEQLFSNVPAQAESPPYEVQRVDAKWNVRVGDFEYIYDLEAPANDEWTKLWFDFLARTPEGELANTRLQQEVAHALRKVLVGQTLLSALCGDYIANRSC
ncbi:MAG: hypothetical protein ACLF0G_17470 [Candidatus Brocadiia bacterium]